MMPEFYLKKSLKQKKQNFLNVFNVTRIADMRLCIFTRRSFFLALYKDC